ncbi:LysE family transporter [Lichenihabitans sp. Uapishka_5]|uniref:LysE family transporter n=1 Tax=Lichenihabitans sp. Uapishka_5 TaxID=3037302 RepID=UPI0029E80A1A|nr:LysE family transporter [Lichenihabitans sp. Uapishka_5]MDX7952427.1 LysE family transporter [Lichenihabitans sp. Uapishka_5]
MMIDRDTTSILSQLAVAYGCMLAIPGPNAAVVLQSVRERSAFKPVLAAAGVATGAALAAAIAASSAKALPQGGTIRVAGGVIVAAVMLRAALRLCGPPWSEPAANASTKKPSPGIAPFALGFATAALNPLSVPYFAAFFVSHACTPTAMGLACCTVFLMAGAWFAAIGVAASRLHGVAWSPLCRRAGSLVVAAILAGLATRSLWLAFSL